MTNEELNNKMVEFDQVTNEARRLTMEETPDRNRINELVARRNRLRREIDAALKEQSFNHLTGYARR